MSKYIDITVPITPEMPVWPESLPVRFDKVFDMAHGDAHTDTDLHFSAHTGTHIDAPAHFVKNGKTVSDIPLDVLNGSALVIELMNVDVITSQELNKLMIPPNTKRLLIKTRNSNHWASGEMEFQKDFIALRKDAAQWIVNEGISLVAVDYLSVQPYYDGPETHQILLGADVIALEGVNLSNVNPGEYELICLPMRLIGTEGAPVRVLLKKTI